MWSAAVVFFILFAGAAHGSVRTIDAAISYFGPQHFPAVRAFIEELACVGRHEFFLFESAFGTGDRRCVDDIHGQL
jgi:hypothetical protein